MENKDYSILLVDDSSVNNLLLENVLVEEGYNVYTAFNALEAFDIISESSIDIMLLDIMMPEMNGLELYEKINNEIRDHNISVIMVTALKEGPERDRADELGAIDYITKPIDINDVLDKIEAVIKKRSES